MKALLRGSLFVLLCLALPAEAHWRLVVMGPAGSGKGTAADILQQTYGIPILSGGALVQEEIDAKTTFGLNAAALKKAGDLIPDTPEGMGYVLAKAKAWLRLHRDKFIIDGIPRTPWQAIELGKILDELGIRLDGAVEIQCGLPMVKLRALGRLQCKACNVSYHRDLKPPKRTGLCDRCGCALWERPEDNEAAVTHRYEDYQRKRTGIVDYYRGEKVFFTVNGEKESGEVIRELLAQLPKR